VHGLCDFVVDPGLSSVECRPDPAASPEQLVLLLRGSVLAFVLGLRRECALHASAVQLPGSGRVVAFVAPSSGGKSTMAALSCAAGARLVVDDLLRLDPSRPGDWIGKSAELRLRLRAGESNDWLDPDWRPRVTVDGRLAVTPLMTAQDTGSLDALAVLRLSPEAVNVGLELLSPAEAVLALSRYPRLAVWTSSSVLESSFSALAELAAVTPVFVATVPWRAPLVPSLGSDVLEALQGAIAAKPSSAVAS
jgi:hypothetical protein